MCVVVEVVGLLIDTSEFQWQPKFNPLTQTHSLIWIRLYGLSLEF